MINLVVIGCGYWGRNLVRNFNQLPAANLYGICDQNPEVLGGLKHYYPGAKLVDNYLDFLVDEQVKAVVVATPSSTHYGIAKGSLQYNKHTFVEKPLALSLREGEELVEIARRQNKVLMVGHLLKYHPAVVKLKELIELGELGDIYYVYSQRVNLGQVRRDENVLWSLAVHDISVILHLLGLEPYQVSAHGAACLKAGVEDIVFVTLYFPGNILANIHVSWLDPHKVRRMTIVGNKKMAVFDDMEPEEKVKIYDKGVEYPAIHEGFMGPMPLRFGDIHIPKIDSTEPLRIECQHFLECIEGGKRPLSDGEDGLNVLRILEAAQNSLKSQEVPVGNRQER